MFDRLEFKCNGIGLAFHIPRWLDLQAVGIKVLKKRRVSQNHPRQSDTFPSSFPLTPIVQIAVRPMHQRPPYPTCRLTSDLLAETDHNPSRNLFRRAGHESPKLKFQISKIHIKCGAFFRLGFGSAEMNFGVQIWRWESSSYPKMAAINKLKNLLWNLKVPTIFSGRPKCGACVSLNRSISSSTKLARVAVPSSPHLKTLLDGRIQYIGIINICEGILTSEIRMPKPPIWGRDNGLIYRNYI